MIDYNKQYSIFFPFTFIGSIPVKRKLKKPKIRFKFKKTDKTYMKVAKTFSNRRVRNIK